VGRNRSYANVCMAGKGWFPTIFLVVVAVAVIAVTWVALEMLSRVIGVGPTLLLSPLPFVVAIWGLIRLRRK